MNELFSIINFQVDRYISDENSAESRDHPSLKSVSAESRHSLYSQTPQFEALR
jgi:hypothetical protein